jgi:hypothetical protein
LNRILYSEESGNCLLSPIFNFLLRRLVGFPGDSARTRDRQEVEVPLHCNAIVALGRYAPVPPIRFALRNKYQGLLVRV